MPPKTSKKSNDDAAWAKLLGDALKLRENKPKGDGWKTCDELQELFGCAKLKALRIMNLMISEGRAESYRGTEYKNGRLLQGVWYRPKM
jgi:hypothetical protein